MTLVPKKGLEPPHPCGYMDLNHARLPIPPLRLGTASAVASQGYLQRRSTSTILQTLARLSNQRSRDSAERQTAMVPTEEVTRLRSLTHDLSNSMETILQASYLLAQVELDPNGRKWVELIEEAARDAANINRMIREILRSQP